MDNCILSNNQPRYLSPLLPQSFAFPGSHFRAALELSQITRDWQRHSSFFNVIWSLLPPSCPNPITHEGIIRVQSITCLWKLPLSPGNCSWPETEPGRGSCRVWVFAPVLTWSVSFGHKEELWVRLRETGPGSC